MCACISFCFSVQCYNFTYCRLWFTFLLFITVAEDVYYYPTLTFIIVHVLYLVELILGSPNDFLSDLQTDLKQTRSCLNQLMPS